MGGGGRWEVGGAAHISAAALDLTVRAPAGRPAEVYPAPGTLHPATGPVLEEPAVHGGRALYPVPCTVDEAAPHEELRPPRPYSESEAYPEPEVPNPHTNTTSDEPGPGPGGHTGHT